MRIRSHEEGMRRLLRWVVLCSAITAVLSVSWTTFALWAMYRVGMGMARAVETTRVSMLDLFEVDSVDAFTRQVDDWESRATEVQALGRQARRLMERMNAAQTREAWCGPATELVALLDQFERLVDPIVEEQSPGMELALGSALAELRAAFDYTFGDRPKMERVREAVTECQRN